MYTWVKHLLSLHRIKTIDTMSEAKITSIGQTSAVGLFSIIFEGDSQTEFRKFIEKFKDDAVRNKELNVILTQIGRIQQNGALERYFRYEGKMSDHVMALPVLQSSLRLYCLRMSDSVLIVGNGGIFVKIFEKVL